MVQKHALRIVTDVLKQNLNITINKTQRSDWRIAIYHVNL